MLRQCIQTLCGGSLFIDKWISSFHNSRKSISVEVNETRDFDGIDIQVLDPKIWGL